MYPAVLLRKRISANINLLSAILRTVHASCFYVPTIYVFPPFGTFLLGPFNSVNKRGVLLHFAKPYQFAHYHPRGWLSSGMFHHVI
jgi:hypothetical protein